MDTGGAGWSLQTIIGAALLAVVLLWAVIRNRRARGDRDRTEEATRELYREEDKHRDKADDDVP